MKRSEINAALDNAKSRRAEKVLSDFFEEAKTPEEIEQIKNSVLAEIEAYEQEFAQRVKNAAQIYVDDTIDVEVNDIDYAVFKFVPEHNGVYTLKSLSDKDTVAVLFDNELNQIAYNDDGDDGNFCLECELSKGQTYYYGVCVYSDTYFGTFAVNLFANELLCDHENNIVKDSGTLASCKEIGFTAGVYCNDCEKWISGHEVIPMHTDGNNDNLCDICGTIIDEDLFLAVLKTAAIAEINNAKTEANATIADKAIAAINAVTTVENVTAIKTKALTDMAKADEDAAAAKALAEAKTTAIAEINNAKTEANATIAEKAIAEINAAKTVEAVNLIKTTALSDMADNPTEPEDPSKTCGHLCHKSGFIGFIWKIVNFFNIIFGANKTCSCGVAHY